MGTCSHLAEGTEAPWAVTLAGGPGESDLSLLSWRGNDAALVGREREIPVLISTRLAYPRVTGVRYREVRRYLGLRSVQWRDLSLSIRRQDSRALGPHTARSSHTECVEFDNRWSPQMVSWSWILTPFLS